MKLFLRRKRALPPVRPVRLMSTTPDHPLREELVRHLYWWFGQIDATDIRRARWVMSTAWENECRISLMDAVRGFNFQLPMQILGIPTETRDGAGPPHLELTDARADAG